MVSPELQKQWEANCDQDSVKAGLPENPLRGGTELDKSLGGSEKKIQKL